MVELYMSEESCCECRTGYFKVLEYGTFYYPAWKHYGKHVTVICDRCNKSNLKSCLGYGNYDLCLSCADELTDPFNTSYNKYDLLN